MTTIGFVGMTHLGLNSAVASATLGVDVVCFDNDAQHIEALAAGETTLREPQLEQLMQAYSDQLHFSHALEDLAQCGLIYIAPDVPTDHLGKSDLAGIRALIKQVDQGLPPQIVLVVLSQVPPGFTRALDLKEGRQHYYQVETLIFGQAIARALQPERIIIGCADPQQPLPADYQHYLETYQCPLLPMRYESAELAKISINCLLVASISTSNTLAELCERTGADWSEIVPALRKDKRIGAHAYLSPGLGIAGGNLERDLNTVVQLAEERGTDAKIVRAFIDNSQYRKHWVLRAMHQQVLNHQSNPQIAVWGLAYKQDTNSTKNAPALALIQSLGSYQIRAYDPAVPVSAHSITAKHQQATDGLDACNRAQVLIIMTPWPEFTSIRLAEIARRMRGRIIIDPYRVLATQNPQAEGFTYITLGTPIGETHAGTPD